MIKFEKVKKYANVDFNLPIRKTFNSAGYDFEVADDITIPSYTDMMEELTNKNIVIEPKSLKQLSEFTKENNFRPTLVTTGVKCYLGNDEYLELSVRSSTPLKYWIIMANGVGIIDSDYADNPDNEGEIFFQIINLSPFPITLHRGDIIGQGIVHKYYTTDDDKVLIKRTGGFGSTTK